MVGIIMTVAFIAYVLGFITYFAVRVGVKELQNLNENGEYIK